MPTVKELRTQSRQYGLPYSRRKKIDLVRQIAETRALGLFKRMQRAIKTGRYPALTGEDIENPHKRSQRRRELHQLDDEVNLALRARKYEQQIKKHPEQRLEPLKKATKRILRQGFRSESLPASIIREGEKLLAEIIPNENEVKGRRTITWKLFRGLDGSTVDNFMMKIQTLQTAFYLRYSFSYRLRNIENGNVMEFHRNLGGSPTLLTNVGVAREWLQEKDSNRFDQIQRPNTKWSFLGWTQVEVKAIMTNQPLLGAGQLPDWLRQKKGLYALDTFDDNLCLFRCIAVHQGTRPNRCTEKAQQLASEFWNSGEPFPKFEMTQLKKAEEKFTLGIRVYEPSEDSTWRLIRQPAHYEAIGIQPMTIGWYNNHAFLIKDIKKLARQYACGHCNQQFTGTWELQRHADRCTSGKTEVICPGKVVERPQSAYEKAFYPKTNASKGSIDWLEYEAEKTKPSYTSRPLWAWW